MKQIGFILSLIVLAVLSSCSNNGNNEVLQRDSEISESIKSTIDEKDQLLLSAMVDQNAKVLESLFSDHMKELVGNNLESMLSQVDGLIKSTEYAKIHQYYVVSTDEELEINSDIDGEAFTLKPNFRSEVNFISLLSFQTGSQHFLMTNIYGKYGESWKIDLTQIGPLSIGNDLASAMYKKAKNQFEKGHLVDAANSMYICSQLLKPSGELLSYDNEKEIMAFYKTSYEEVRKKHQFPDTLIGLKTMPIIASIIPQITDNGIIPEVKYLTSAELTDSAMIRIEREQIHQELIHRYEGFAENNDSVILMTFPVDPDKLEEPITVRKSNELTASQDKL